MNIDELNRIIDEEDLNGDLLYINDARKSELYEETRPPHSITMNIVDDNNYQLFFYDERGYKIVSQTDLSENVACETALYALRNQKKRIQNDYNASNVK